MTPPERARSGVVRRLTVTLTEHDDGRWIGSVALAPADFNVYDADTAEAVLTQIAEALRNA